ncbi:MAG: hypothetical protein K2L89_05295, partial [Muribaculaceae bacterium]|nr:hypothetical protein [Muribaculaceae bacterium]
MLSSASESIRAIWWSVLKHKGKIARVRRKELTRAIILRPQSKQLIITSASPEIDSSGEAIKISQVE